jgi:hypothetical protein
MNPLSNASVVRLQAPAETILEEGTSGLEQRSGPQATVSGIFTSANGRAGYHGFDEHTLR